MPARFEGLMVGTPPPLCNSPTLEINGTQGAPHPAASQADAYLFQVEMVITNHHDGDDAGEIGRDRPVLQDCV